MEYGILIAVMYGELEENDKFQVIGAISNMEDVRELTVNYLKNGPDNQAIPADEFQIHRRGPNGFYSIIETITL